MSSSDFEEKVCPVCDRVLSLSCFYTNAAKCKECIRDLGALKRAEAMEHEPEPKRARTFETGGGTDLYVMAISTDPLGGLHGLKVGRSCNIPQRAASLSESMPFNILVLATFPGAGHLEKAIHAQLDTTRNATGRGREWFHTTLPNITHAVACAMQSSPKTNAGPSGSS
jgi:hypothetical protein